MDVIDLPLGQIIPYARNPRHNEKAVATVAASIAEFGWRQPIVVNEAMVVLAGHTRLAAAQQLGFETAPVHVAKGLSEAQARAFRIMDNRSGENAEWDNDLLGLELGDLQAADFDLDLTGFTDDELNNLLNGLDEGDGAQEAGRTDELFALLDLRQNRMWSDDRFGAEALVRQGRLEEALAFAEERLALERQGYNQSEIGRFCEDVLFLLGRRDEAYARYGLSAGRGSTYVAIWRDLVKRYPERDPREILVDLMALHGNRGKWFAAAKDAGCFDIALQCAADPNVEPATLVRAARDFRDRDPSFAAHVALQAIEHYLAGRGYEPSPRDAEAAISHLHHSAQNAGKLGWAYQMLERLLTDKTGKDLLMYDLFSRMKTQFEVG